MAGSMGLDMAWAGRGVAGMPRSGAAGALQGPWVPGSSWGGRFAGRAGGRGASRRSAPAVSVAPAHPAAARRPRLVLGIGWRRLASLAGDVLMALVWAAMIPGLMWLGAAAGF